MPQWEVSERDQYMCLPLNAATIPMAAAASQLYRREGDALITDGARQTRDFSQIGWSLKYSLKNNMMQTLQVIENEEDYKSIVARYEAIRKTAKGTLEHTERLRLATMIHQYEEKLWELPAVDPAELTKLRKEEFGYNQ